MAPEDRRKTVKELSKHADKAKEWIEWLNNVNDAPHEIRLLSSKVKIAKDTVSQIQISLEARPDLVEDESGQNLKMQIEEVIDGTSETLKKMSRLLSGFTAAAGQDGTALDRLEGFWQSFTYKNEGEGQIRATDNELQIQLTELTTLMSNIYASPKMANSTSLASATTPITVAKVPEPTSGASTLETVSPQSTSNNEERDRAREMASRSNSRDIGTSDDPDDPYPFSSSRQRHKTSNRPAPVHAASQLSALPPPRISIDHDRTATEVLLDAAWDGDLRSVAEALKHAPPNACDHQNLTALHFAVERDHMAVAMLLLDRGANVHSRADGGCLPLHLAARYASADTVEMLLDRAGADPNARSSDGRTALHYAARSAVDGDDERREVIRTLRDWGTDPTLATKKGETPRDVAVKRDHWDAAATLRRAEKKWEQDHGHMDGKPAQHRLQYKVTES
ncbi:Ankyrin-3 [Escovopsis weberi]|uniref:Ankyrin-3 n=1 Tax=Escovopsis weberi TaxID=150374 RepID=A0A0M9VUE5_ESCWE|nr:Ankyrin-3 [Escovopsis weberi]